MTEYLIQSETLTALADAIRNKSGYSDTMTPNAMIDAINNITINPIELVNVTFPEYHTSECLYYTNSELNFQELKRETNEVITITIPKNSIIVSDMNAFDGNNYTWDSATATSINSVYKNAICIHEDMAFGWSDNAPV